MTTKNTNVVSDALHTLGIDIGSTTVKIAILDKEHNLLFQITRDILPIFVRPSPDFCKKRMLSLVISAFVQ